MRRPGRTDTVDLLPAFPSPFPLPDLHLHLGFGPPWRGDAHRLEHLLARDLAPGQADGHAGARVGGGADEIEAVDARVLGRWAEGEHVEEAVAEPEDGALVEVEQGLPTRRRVDGLVHDGLLQRGGACARFDGGEDGGAGVGDDGGPVLLVLAGEVDAFAAGGVVHEVAHGDESDNGIFAVGRGSGIDPRRYVDVEGRLHGDGLLLEDVVKRFAVLVGEENVVRGQLRDLAVHRPVERDRATASSAGSQRISERRGWEEMVICVDKVGVDNHHIGCHRFTGTEKHASCPLLCWIEGDTRDRGRKTIGNTESLSHLNERIDNLMEAALGIPDPFGELGVLKERICGGSIERGHSHVHAPKRENPTQPLRPKIDRGTSIDALKRVESKQVAKERRSQHGKQRRKVASQDVSDAELIVTMGFLEKAEIAFKSILALPFFHFGLHVGNVSRECEALAIAKPQVVVGLTFHQFHPFGVKGGVEVLERLPEQMRKKDERGPLVKSLPKTGSAVPLLESWEWQSPYVSPVVNQGASSTGEIIFLDDSDLDTGLGKSSSCSNPTDASTLAIKSIMR